MKPGRFSRGAVRAVKPRGCDDHPLDYKDLDFLEKFLTPQGQIQGRRRTGYCAQCQRDLKRAVKRARHLALLSFVGG